MSFLIFLQICGSYSKKRYDEEMNKKRQLNKYRGIQLDRDTGMWRARYHHTDGKQICSTPYEHAEDAAKAHDKFVRALRQKDDQDQLNFPDCVEQDDNKAREAAKDEFIKRKRHADTIEWFNSVLNKLKASK